MKLPSFITELMSDVDLGDVILGFTDARTEGNKLVLTTEIDFTGSPFWPMYGELVMDPNDEAVDSEEEDPKGLMHKIMYATSVEQLPESQTCKSKFVRWLAELKYEELTGGTNAQT